ncbi:MAG TPA: GNAT family N-acetyltransferase [Clostridiaceae bacterium]|nr:GNAT family N-acetyltransferase [Clostridiaceae bacterium]
MKIRQGKADDLQAVVKIAEAAWERIYAGYKEQIGEELFNGFYSNWKKNKVSEIRDSVMSGNWRLYVTEKDGEIVAFITIMINKEERTGVIGNNAVHPKYQGLGLGTKQYNYVLDVMKNEGVLYVKVFTGGDDAHAPARRAYEKAGFSVKIPSVTYYMKLK